MSSCSSPSWCQLHPALNMPAAKFKGGEPRAASQPNVAPSAKFSPPSGQILKFIPHYEYVSCLGRVWSLVAVLDCTALYCTAGYPHNPYNGVICNDVIAASGVFTTKELWKYSKGNFQFSHLSHLADIN